MLGDEFFEIFIKFLIKNFFEKNFFFKNFFLKNFWWKFFWKKNFFLQNFHEENFDVFDCDAISVLSGLTRETLVFVSIMTACSIAVHAARDYGNEQFIMIIKQ